MTNTRKQLIVFKSKELENKNYLCSKKKNPQNMAGATMRVLNIAYITQHSKRH